MSSINSLGTSPGMIAYQQKERNRETDNEIKERPKDGEDKQVSEQQKGQNAQPTNLQIDNAVSKIDVMA